MLSARGADGWGQAPVFDPTLTTVVASGRLASEPRGYGASIPVYTVVIDEFGGRWWIWRETRAEAPGRHAEVWKRTSCRLAQRIGTVGTAAPRSRPQRGYKSPR